MAFLFADDIGVEIPDAGFPAGDAVDVDGNAVGHLFGERREQLFADHLGAVDGLRGFGDHFLGIIGHPLGQQGKKLLFQDAHAFAVAGAEGNDGGESAKPREGGDRFQNAGFIGRLIDLIDDENGRLSRALELGEDLFLQRGGAFFGGGDQDLNIGVGQAAEGGAVHIPSELAFGGMDAGRIEENDLALPFGQDPDHTAARGLRAGGGDGDLALQKGVEKGGFPDVGQPGEGDEGGAVNRHGRAPVPWRASRRFASGA